MVERALSSAAGERPSADRIGGGMKAHQRPIEAEENCRPIRVAWRDCDDD